VSGVDIDDVIIEGDAVEVLRRLPDGCVDLMITDPPYESLEKHRAVGTTTRLKQSASSSNPWFRIFPNRRFPELFTEIQRVMARNSHVYFFCDEETAFIVKPIAEAAGLRFWKSLIWVKTKKNRLPARDVTGARTPAELAEASVAVGMGYHWRASTERILFFEKGRRALVNRSWPDVLFAHRILDGYPTEKPPAIIERLIVNSSSPGERVADPFCGSGNVGLVARKLNRRYFLSDISPAEAMSRLRGEAEGATTVRTLREKEQLLLEALRQRERDGIDASIDGVAADTGYAASTIKTYFSKKLDGFIVTRTERGDYKVRGALDCTEEQFARRMSQKEGDTLRVDLETLSGWRGAVRRLLNEGKRRGYQLGEHEVEMAMDLMGEGSGRSSPD